MNRYILLAALFAVGCGHDSKGNTPDGGAADLSPVADMVDTTTPPAPTATHVGGTAPTCCMVTLGASLVAYLQSPTGSAPQTGELRVATKDGIDKHVDNTVPVGGYALSPDGKSIVYTKVAGQTASLYWADITAATVTPKQVFASGVFDPQIQRAGFYSPSGHYFLVGVLPTGVANSPDLHVIDTSNGTDVYKRLNGEYDYIELVLPDDTLIFQDTAGGTSTTTPPVQTLYWISLPKVASSTAAVINTRTASLTPTADNKTLVYVKTNGDLYAWDLAAKTGTGNKIATGVVKFTLGTDSKGPIAYIASDRSLHVLQTDGTKLLDVSSVAAADPFGSIVLSPDASDVFYFQQYDTQNNRGTLVRVPMMAGAAPSKVGDKISSVDLQIMDDALLLVQNVDDLGQLGDVAKANRDGSNVTPLGTKVNVGGLRAVNPGPATWVALHLTNAALDTVNSPIDGSPAILGALQLVDSSGGAALSLDPKVHAGAFAFATDDGRTAAFVTGAAFDASASNYVGSLALLATRAPSMKVDGKLSGVSELGPIVKRSLFVNAPTASPAGVYFVTY